MKTVSEKYNILIKKIMSINMNGLFICESCDIQFGDQYELFREHMTEHNTMILCHLCAKQLEGGRLLAEHIWSDHYTNASTSTSHEDTALTPSDALEDSFPCPLCDFISPDTDGIQLHFAMAHEGIVRDDAALAASSTTSTTTSLSTTQSSSIHQVDEGQCPFCQSIMPVAVLAEHVELHMETDTTTAIDMASREAAVQAETKELQKAFGMDSSSSYEQQGRQALDRRYAGKRGANMSIADYHEQRIALIRESGKGVGVETSRPVAGLAANMARLSTYDHNVAQVIVATHADHYPSSEADRGFGCGFRNIQMMMSVLKHDSRYRPLIWPDATDASSSEVPSVPRLQQWIESAWSLGFDPMGAQQLGQKLSGTRKWIGATEIYMLMASMGIDCQILEFTKWNEDKNHPKIFKALWEHFAWQERQQSQMDQRPITPVYLQYQGHSITVMGIQRVHTGEDGCFHRLLTFDPMDRRHKMDQIARSNTPTDMKMLVMDVHRLCERKYQLVLVHGLLDEQMKERVKTVPNVRRVT